MMRLAYLRWPQLRDKVHAARPTLLLLWLLPWAPAGAAAGTPVVLRDELPVQQVWSALTVLADPSRVLTVQEVMADPSQWHPPPGTSGT